MTIATAFAPYAVTPSEVDGLPDTGLVVAPGSIEDAERILDLASEHGMRTTIWGGGTHQGMGGRVDPDLVISTARLARILDWQPEDLTVTVEAGVKVSELESRVAERAQTAVLPELPGEATVGGVLAAGASGWRRARYGPTRERVLEVDLVTGDGRHVRAGGRVVKNVTGFDLARLAVGSLGSLGLIARTCLKLWPIPTTRATVIVDDGDSALERTYRPTAVVETDGSAKVFLGGTEAEVEGQARALGGRITDDWSWDPEPVGPVRWSIRVPPAAVRSTIERLPNTWRYQAGLGIGEIRVSSPDADGVADLRSFAERSGGAMVLVDGPDELYTTVDPWGTPPEGLEIQRRIVDRFDPARVLNPGRLPGGI